MQLVIIEQWLNLKDFDIFSLYYVIFNFISIFLGNVLYGVKNAKPNFDFYYFKEYLCDGCFR